MCEQKERKYYKLSKSQLTLLLASCFTVERKKVLQANLVPFALYAENGFDMDAMEKALNCLLYRIDSLRLRLAVRPGGLRQYVDSFAEYHPKRITLPGREAFRTYARNYYAFIPLFSPQLFCAELVDCGNGGGGVILCMHHLISDGYSADLLANKLDVYYTAYKKGEEPPEEKIYSVTRFFENEAVYLKNDIYKADRKFWFQQYNHQPRYSFPAGRLTLKSNIGLEEFDIKGEQYQKLMGLCRTLNCSFTSAVMALSGLMIRALHGDENFCLYTIHHGRIMPMLKKTAGCFFNVIPVFYDLRMEHTAEEYLRESYMQYLECMSHGRYPTSNQIFMAVKETFIKRFGYNHIWCVFSNMGQEELAPAALEYIPHPETYMVELFYCGLYNRPKEDTLHIELHYQNRRFTAKQIKRIIRTFVQILEIVCDAPGQTLNEVFDSLSLEQ